MGMPVTRSGFARAEGPTVETASSSLLHRRPDRGRIRWALVAAAMALGATVAVSPALATSSTAAQTMPGAGLPFAVACTSATTCVSVAGSLAGLGAALVPITNGVPGPAQLVPGAGTLQGVACPTATTCIAVGQNAPVRRNDPRLAVVVLITNGTPGPVQVLGLGLLQAVACPTASTCVAVGTSALQGIVVPITNGVAGATQVVPEAQVLSGVACPSATSCLAVGNFVTPDFAFQGVLVRIANGLAGAAAVVPGSGGFNGIACQARASDDGRRGAPRGRTCQTVGSDEFGLPAVVSITNGSPGTPQMVSDVEVLTAIACPSATTCEATGFFETSAMVVPIVNGTPAAAHAVSGANALYGIGCSSTTSCQAVGLNSPTPGVNLGVVATISEATPTRAKDCRNGGWTTFINPPFASQAACLRYVDEARG